MWRSRVYDKLIPVEHQVNGNGHGWFTLAFVTDFTESIDPSEWNYEKKL